MKEEKKGSVEVIYEGYNIDQGWQRWTKLTGDEATVSRLLERLRLNGCNAFVGREQCGAYLEPDTELIIGWAELIFLSYKCAYPIPLESRTIYIDYWLNSSTPLPDQQTCAVALFCKKHQNDMTVDMPRSLRRKQERQVKKFIESGLRKQWFGF